LVKACPLRLADSITGIRYAKTVFPLRAGNGLRLVSEQPFGGVLAQVAGGTLCSRCLLWLTIYQCWAGADEEGLGCRMRCCRGS